MMHHNFFFSSKLATLECSSLRDSSRWHVAVLVPTATAQVQYPVVGKVHAVCLNMITRFDIEHKTIHHTPRVRILEYRQHSLLWQCSELDTGAAKDV